MQNGDIGINKSVLAPKNNNTEPFATLQPRKDDVFARDSVLKISKTRIENAVDDMLKSTRSIGLFGETMYSPAEPSFESTPEGNTVLAKSSKISSRVATSADDLDIANLRLSVFSNFNPESRKLFCERSCQLLSSRRQRGATCIVATTKSTTTTKTTTTANKNCDSNAEQEQEQTTSTTAQVDVRNNAKEIENANINENANKKPEDNIVGTAEISFHEFSRTLLGYSRPKDSVLYVTEVAVDLEQRRKGIARLMMEAIDALAKIRDVETIYLHVDVTNSGAVRLYENAGYRKLNSTNPMYLEFTKTLNLHDGATRGRCHYLMAKDVQVPTWLNIQEQRKQHEPQKRRTLGIEVMPSF